MKVGRTHIARRSVCGSGAFFLKDVVLMHLARRYATQNPGKQQPPTVQLANDTARRDEMTRMRPACARIPVAAMAIDLMKSIMANHRAELPPVCARELICRAPF
jgi:hypothetical protein